VNAALTAIRAWWLRHPRPVAGTLLAIVVLAAAGMVLAARWLPRDAIAVPAAIHVAAVLLLRFTPDDEESDSNP
jgi:hypothetical protein